MFDQNAANRLTFVAVLTELHCAFPHYCNVYWTG